jgi:hypothetical protein
MSLNPGYLTTDELTEAVNATEIDTVIVAVTDMQGGSSANASQPGSFSRKSPNTAPIRATTY